MHENAQRIAKGLAHHPIGVVLLARLAVDQSQQGKGLGKALLFDALSRIEEAADIVGVRAVLVHAIDDAARRFYLHFEFEEPPVDPFQLLLLLKDFRRSDSLGTVTVTCGRRYFFTNPDAGSSGILPPTEGAAGGSAVN